MFEAVKGKRASKCKVQCTRAGCGGTCPLSVVVRGSQKDGIPAKCYLCDRKYKLPPGAAGLQQGGRKASKATNGERARRVDDNGAQAARKLLAEKDKRIAALQQQLAAGSVMHVDAEEAADKPSEKVQGLLQQIKGIKEMDESTRAILQPQGGYDAVLEKLQLDLKTWRDLQDWKFGRLKD